MSGWLLDYLRLGIGNVWRQKIRSSLTLLGITIGIGALIMMSAVGTGAQREILSNMESLGLRNIEIMALEPTDDAPQDDENSSGRQNVIRYGVTFQDLKRCRETVPGLVRAAPVRKVREKVYLNGRVHADVQAVTPEYFQVFPMDVVVGRNLSDLDNHLNRQYCVLQSPLPRRVLGLKNPLDVELLVGPLVFKVVGVVRPEAMGPQDEAQIGEESVALKVLVPFETAINRFGTVSRKGPESRDQIDVEIDRLILECRDPLLSRRVVYPLMEYGHERKDYDIQVPLELLRQQQETRQQLNLFLLIVAGLTLAVGGVGVMNIMLVSVSERTREIGVRRAIGARRRDIIWQFLIETVALTLVGGVLGGVVGAIFTAITWASTGWPVSIAWWVPVGCLVLSVLTGLAFGLYPARKAAEIQPVEALRYE